MSVYEIVPIQRLRVNYTPLNPDTLALANYLVQGGKVPPVKVVRQADGSLLVTDGRHRTAAHKLAGLSEISVRYGVPCNAHETDA